MPINLNRINGERGENTNNKNTQKTLFRMSKKTSKQKVCLPQKVKQESAKIKCQ